jgi:hypothetical protein
VVGRLQQQSGAVQYSRRGATAAASVRSVDRDGRRISAVVTRSSCRHPSVGINSPSVTAVGGYSRYRSISMGAKFCIACCISPVFLHHDCRCTGAVDARSLKVSFLEPTMSRLFQVEARSLSSLSSFICFVAMLVFLLPFPFCVCRGGACEEVRFVGGR